MTDDPASIAESIGDEDILEKVDITQMDKDSINPGTMLLFPEPDPSYSNICLITDDIPLQLLYSAYMQGAFPWFNEDEGEPVVWYSPNPRFCLRIENLHIPKSLDKFLKHCPYTFSMDRDFESVIKACRNMDRPGQDGTWIGNKIVDAYTGFYKAGYAHSVEVWHDGKLCGGLYGVLIGSVFCGESMFTAESNSAKCAFALFSRAFAACGGKLIDSQVYTDNIARYGATNISRDAFLRLEGKWLTKPLEMDIQQAFCNELQRWGIEYASEIQ